MRAGRTRSRVLVLCCPDWPEHADPSPPQDAGPAPDGLAFEQVVSVVEEFCPQVEVLRPGSCAIGARGPARYFGGEAELAKKITQAVARRGFSCRAGIADDLFAARLAAQRAGQPAAAGQPAGVAGTPAGQSAAPGGPVLAGRFAVPGQPSAAGQPAEQAGGWPRTASWLIVPAGGSASFLASQPVAVLDAPDLDDLLPRLGITTLGEFAALPATEALNRFGAQGAHAHRLARGLDPRPPVPRLPTADLSVQCEFEPAAELAEPVVFAAKTLAEQMHARLAASGLACVRVQAQVTLAGGTQITRLWRHDGLLSALAVAERVRWQLDGWRTGQRGPGSPDSTTSPSDQEDPFQPGGITLLRLIPDQLVRDDGYQLALWGDAVVSDQVARAAIRVQAMLGHDAVVRPVLAGGRSPADQVILVPFGDNRTPLRPADRPWPGTIPPPAPATVYPVSLAATVADESGSLVAVDGRAQISGPPAWLSLDGGLRLAVISWAGPWPVTERWWDPESSRRRARFQLITDDGSAWLAAVQGGQWAIEASYD